MELSGSRRGKVAYIVTVPQGKTAHQASDLRYYKRFNFESVPMQDHEIRDVNNRLKFPLVNAEFFCERQREQGSTQVYDLHVFLRNNGAMCARDMKLVYYWPTEIKHELQAMASHRLGQKIIYDEITVPGIKTQNVRISASLEARPPFPEDVWELSREDVRYSIKFTVDLKALEFLLQKNPSIVWKVYADDMPPQEGKIPISELPGFDK